MHLPDGAVRSRLGRLLAALVLVVAAMGPTGSAAASDAQVEAVQRRLVDLGYDAGVADGLMGPRTRTAIRSLQSDRGLTQSGRIDAATLAALGLAQEAQSTRAVSEAPAKAPTETALIRYERVGWQGPSSAQTVRERFRASRDAPLMARVHDILIVPNPERIYILGRGEGLGELPCDPSAGTVHAELMLYAGGPVMFTPLDEAGLCQLGLGIVLSAGRNIMLGETAWAELSSPAGRVRLGGTGLEFQ